MLCNAQISANKPSVCGSLMSDLIINADLWSDKPEILSADWGFDGGIEIAPFTEENVKNNGMAWSTVTCSYNSTMTLTRGTSTSSLPPIFGTSHIVSGDGFPVIFSYPVLTSTADPSDFEVV